MTPLTDTVQAYDAQLKINQRKAIECKVGEMIPALKVLYFRLTAFRNGENHPLTAVILRELESRGVDPNPESWTIQADVDALRSLAGEDVYILSRALEGAAFPDDDGTPRMVEIDGRPYYDTPGYKNKAAKIARDLKKCKVESEN